MSRVLFLDKLRLLLLLPTQILETKIQVLKSVKVTLAVYLIIAQV